MEFANEFAHRALAYVAAVSDQGYLLNENEFTEYVTSPRREEKVEYPAHVQVAAQVATLSGLSPRREPTESVLQWLVRLGWLEVDQSGEDEFVVEISPLGRRVLRIL